MTAVNDTHVKLPNCSGGLLSFITAHHPVLATYQMSLEYYRAGVTPKQTIYFFIPGTEEYPSNVGRNYKS